MLKANICKHDLGWGLFAEDRNGFRYVWEDSGIWAFSWDLGGGKVFSSLAEAEAQAACLVLVGEIVLSITKSIG